MGVKVGRPKKIKSPQELWQLFEDYRLWVKEHPVELEAYVGHSADRVTKRLPRCLNFDRFKLFCSHQSDKSIKAVDEYFRNRTGGYDMFSRVCKEIKMAIRADQIEGGMAGVYNASITQRLNNLHETTQVRVSREQPLFGPSKAQ